ncbi:MAG TPA: anhydro-N-acetylmuramic acid kinase [Bacteroidetes bacterium]|nr:anhydro-N-acetylmuramic acid kinase [Bacteroidota bacterium]
MRTYKILGLMSGTSMDGVDLAYCSLQEEEGRWSYEILLGETIPYDEKWRVRLSQLGKQTALIYVKTHTFYGHYLGQLCAGFIAKHQLEPDFIASHGHTIFHQPEAGFTAQIGDGSAISAVTGLPVVSDFRLLDLALFGQGAPLVPIGDELLFGEYDFCLNLGGFANISMKEEERRLAFDIAPCNLVLNRIARNLGHPYDDGGQIAASGSVHYELLKELDALPFYQEFKPKSIGREWLNTHFWPLVRKYDLEKVAQENLMKTLVDHISGQIADAIEHYAGEDIATKKVLITGGGAYNETLIDHLRSQCDAHMVVPENPLLVEYKEALIFAFLGVLRVRQETNTLASVTGAKSDSIGGAMWGDFSRILN